MGGTSVRQEEYVKQFTVGDVVIYRGDGIRRKLTKGKTYTLIHVNQAGYIKVRNDADKKHLYISTVFDKAAT